MIEKFSDYESVGFISSCGDFTFTVKSCELKDSKAGNPMVVIDVEADEGKSTLYFSLSPKARCKYNNFIKACLHDRLDTPDKIKEFQLDYETIHTELVNKKFIGHVIADTYEKEIKTPLDDGTFDTDYQEVTTYKIDTYDFVK